MTHIDLIAWGMPTWGAIGAGLVYVLAALLMAAGALGCVLPYPGTLLGLVGCICWALAGGEPYPPAWVWVALSLLALLGSFVDNLFALMGAKRFGSSRAATWCSVLGLFVGSFYFPVGIILGPFLGAFLAELLISRRNVGASTYSGIGALLGSLMGMVAKLLILGIMLGIFFWC